ncbi:hypothetical protein [Brevibacillus porteri]|uniref:hypothetical protein n=1 Tax=Brevibacillus porteri TaxID=2126350 RepID=UPI00362D9E84
MEYKLNEIILRTKTTKWYYQKTDEKGHLFYRSDNKKGFYVPDNILQEYIKGKSFKVKMKGITGTFYIDWSLRDQRIERERKAAEKEKKIEKGRELIQMARSQISDDDKDCIGYAEYLNKSYGYNIQPRDDHKVFIYSIRNKYMPHLVSCLGHPKGWNDASKEFFTKMTGVKLPKTKKGVLEALEQWAQ